MKKVKESYLISKMLEMMTDFFASNPSADGELKSNMVKVSNCLWDLKDTVDSMEEDLNDSEDSGIQEEELW